MRAFVTGFVLVAALAASVGKIRGADSRPNIVLAFADDLGRYASIYADPAHPSPNDIIKTPNFDRVAREGVCFDNAFVSAPSCTPSRAAILSSQHFFRNGSHSQLHHPWMQGYDDPWDKVVGWPLMLRDQGYHIGWSYKMHISEDRMGGKQRNYRQAGSRFNSFSQQVSAAADPEHAKQRLLDEVRGNFRAFLADRTDEQPYFYWFNPTNTHRAWVQGSGKNLWGLDPDQLKGKLPAFLPDHPTVREDFADYLGEAMAFDASVGVLLEELTARGELENTIFVVSGDHGAPGFPRGKCNLYDFGTRVPLAVRWPAKVVADQRISTPVSLVDLGPTFLAAVDLPIPEQFDGESLWPVLHQGTAAESALRGYAISGRESHVGPARPDALPYPMRAIRTSDYLYIINFAPDRWPVSHPPLAADFPPAMTGKGENRRRRMDIDFGPTRDLFVDNEDASWLKAFWDLGIGKRPAEELYDVHQDPDQMHNLAGDPEYAEVQVRLRQQLLEELRAKNDPRVVDSGDAFDRPPYCRGL